jgi:hypothetical protein
MATPQPSDQPPVLHSEFDSVTTLTLNHHARHDAFFSAPQAALDVSVGEAAEGIDAFMQKRPPQWRGW